jgi:hypothetical protein
MSLIHPEGGCGVGIYLWIPQPSHLDEGAEMFALKKMKNFPLYYCVKTNIYFIILKSSIFIAMFHNTA